MKNCFEKINTILTVLIILDIILLGSSLIMNDSVYIWYTFIYDSTLCTILIIIFLIKLIKSDSKSYFKENWLDLLASIPLELIILPGIIHHLELFNIIILIRIFRMLLLIKESSKYTSEFFNATSLDKIIALIIVLIIGSCYTLLYFDPAITNLYDSLWYVFQTITSVGYGDLIPQSKIGKLIGLILVMVGVLMFSIITASFAYIFNNKVFKEENEEFYNKISNIKKRLTETKKSIEYIKNKSETSNKEIMYLKDKINKNEQDIQKINEKLDYLINLIEKK